tara:strand:- start:255 stop:809 length:555 start_codon:yes stop_codon:yes gene_type:complete
MNTAEGVVQTIRSARGVSVLLDSGAWYGAGFDSSKIPFKEGNKIKFAYTEKGIYKNIDLNSVEVLDASEASNMKPQEKQTIRGGNTVTRDSYWSNKEDEDKLRSKEIRYEACLQRAIAMVDLLITSGALTLGANAKKKVEIIDNTVDAYTRKFYEEATEARDGAFDAPSQDELNKDLGEEASYE